MRRNASNRISGSAAVALILVCAVMLVPARTGAAESSEVARPVWTATEAEIAREVAEGIPLNDIINNYVRSGESIEVAVLAAIKVGVDPAQVVVTSLNEGYTAEIIVKAALKAGVPFPVVLKSAASSGLNNKSFTVRDIVTAAIRSGADPSLVVRTAIGDGYPAQTVITTALRAGAPLDVVVKSAVDAGIDTKTIYVGAADAGKSPTDVERALRTAGAKLPEETAKKPAVGPSAQTDIALTTASLEPSPAIFGMGGVILTRLPSLSPAPQLIQMGLLKINPFLAIEETFSDNVFFTADNRNAVSITTITPGVRVKLPFHTHSADLEYYSVINRYGKYTEENINDHHVSASVDLVFGNRFEMQLSDKFARDHEPRSSSASGDNEVFHTNAASLLGAYRTSDLTRIQIDYTKSNWRYITSHFRDRDEDLIAGTFFYQVIPRTSVFLEYGHRKIAYSDETLDLDSTVKTLQAGLTWDLSARSKGTLKAGLARKNFTSSNQTNGTVKVGSVDVRHDFSNDTAVVLTAERNINEPDIPGTPYFISTGGYAELTQRLVTNLSAVFRGAYVQDDNAGRIDRTTLGGPGLKYRALDWLEVALDYNVHSRHSNIPTNNYTEHSTMIMVSASL